MPRKAKEKSKSSSYRPTNFSSKNTSLLRFGYCTMLADGKLSRENIIDLSSKTLFGQLKNDGYIKETSEKGVFQTTPKFKNEFSKMIGNESNFGGSTSGENHQKLVSDICSKIPEGSLLEGSFRNGNQLATDNKHYKKTPEFKDKVNTIRQEIYAAQRQNELDYKNKYEGLSDLDKVKLSLTYRTIKNELELQEKAINDNKRGVSAPDFQFTLMKSDSEEFINNLRQLEEREEYCKYKDEWEENITRMENYISECETEEIEIYTEIINENYDRKQIICKENYSRIYEKPVFYFRT